MVAIVFGGKSTKYLGKSVRAEDIDSMSSQEIDKLYTRYEARLVASMTKTLGQSAFQLYSTLVSRFILIPVEKQPFF